MPNGRNISRGMIPASTDEPDDAQSRAAIACTIGDVHEVLRRLENDPAVPAELLQRVRFACSQAWNAGWFTRGLDRRTGQPSTNPFERPVTGDQPSSALTKGAFAPIVIVPGNGQPAAQTGPTLLCDACGTPIHSGEGRRDPETGQPKDRPSIATWWDRYVEENTDEPGHPRPESSPMFHVHKGRCDRAFTKYVQRFYPAEDGWGNRWRPADDVFRQLGHNMAHPLEDDPQLGTAKVPCYPPTRIVNLQATQRYAITPKWLVGNPG